MKRSKFNSLIVAVPVKPKRLQIGERIHAIIIEEIIDEACKKNFSPSDLAGRSTEKIIKIIQNNYRRRIY